MKHKMIRQGDVLLVPCVKPQNFKTVKPESGRHILARGEATGHHHSVLATSSAELATANDELYLLVKEGDALLQHQEHGAIELKRGCYRVVRQREYVAKRIQRVED